MVNSDILTGSFPDNCSFLHFDESHNKIIELKKNPNDHSTATQKDVFEFGETIQGNAEKTENKLIDVIVAKICDTAIEKNDKNTGTCIRILLSLASSRKVELHGLCLIKIIKTLLIIHFQKARGNLNLATRTIMAQIVLIFTQRMEVPLIVKNIKSTQFDDDGYLNSLPTEASFMYDSAKEGYENETLWHNRRSIYVPIKDTSPEHTYLDTLENYCTKTMGNLVDQTELFFERQKGAKANLFED
jgi:hypothetical protein